MPAVVAVITLLLFATVLAYFLTLEAHYSKDREETRKFSFLIKSCEEAEEKAEADFEKEEIRMFFSSGVEDEHHSKFPYSFYKRLEEDFGIDIIYTGDVFSSFHKCYNLKMDDLLDEKLGEHIIEGLFNELRDKEYVQ